MTQNEPLGILGSYARLKNALDDRNATTADLVAARKETAHIQTDASQPHTSSESDRSMQGTNRRLKNLIQGLRSQVEERLSGQS